MWKAAAGCLDWFGRAIIAHQTLSALGLGGLISAIALFAGWFFPIVWPWWPAAAAMLATCLLCIGWLTAWDWSQSVLEADRNRHVALGGDAIVVSIAIQRAIAAGAVRLSLEERNLIAGAMAIRIRIKDAGSAVPSFASSTNSQIMLDNMASFLVGVGELMRQGLPNDARELARASSENYSAN